MVNYLSISVFLISSFLQYSNIIIKNSNIMNDKFVKDSLLPDERILIAAKFHPIKDYIIPMILLITVTLFFIFETCGVTDAELLENVYYSEEGWTINQYGNPFRVIYWGKDGITYEAKLDGDVYSRTTLGKMDYTEVTRLISEKKLEHRSNRQTYFSVYKIIAFWLVNIVLAYAFLKLIKWINSKDEFVITNKRVVAKVGVIRRIAFELQSEQVESIEIYQGFIGRILNYGTLMPTGIGASKVRIGFVVNPFEFRQHFYDLKKHQNID